MKAGLYDLNSVLDFGKFETKKIRVILNTDVSYILWCLLNVSSFMIDRDVEEILRRKCKNDPDVSGALACNEMRKQIAGLCFTEDEDEEYENNRAVYENNTSRARGWDRDNFDAMTDGTAGDYDDWRGVGGDFGSLRDDLGF